MNNVDLNNYKSNGYFTYEDNCSHIPEVAQGYLFVNKAYNAGNVDSIFQVAYTNNKMYRRFLWVPTGNWGEWVQFSQHTYLNSYTDLASLASALGVDSRFSSISVPIGKVAKISFGGMYSCLICGRGNSGQNYMHVMASGYGAGYQRNSISKMLDPDKSPTERIYVDVSSVCVLYLAHETEPFDLHVYSFMRTPALSLLDALPSTAYLVP